MNQLSDLDRPVLTLGLLWHSVNSSNLGIGALTVSHIAIIDDIALGLGIAVRYKVIGWADTEPPYIERTDVDVDTMRAKDLLLPGGLYTTIRACDIVLDISAGDSFADIYGARRFLFNALSKFVVLAARRPLLLGPQTIGPFNRWWTRRIAGFLMRRAGVVVARDHMTTEFLGPFCLGSKVLEATDVAFRLPYDIPPARTGDEVHFGFNVSGLLFNGGYTQNNMFDLTTDYPAAVRSIIRHFNTLPGCKVHLIGHVNTDHQEVEDDYRVSQRLAAEFPGVLVAPRFKTPSDAKSYIAGMDFFCGSRMHACIAALSSGVPVIPIAYSRKFEGLFQTLGYSSLTDCTSQSTAEVIDAVIDAFERREELRALAEESRQRAQEKLVGYELVLRSFLSAGTGITA